MENKNYLDDKRNMIVMLIVICILMGLLSNVSICGSPRKIGYPAPIKGQ